MALNLTTSGNGMFTPNMENPVLYVFRAMAEELADIRGGLPVASNKSDHDLAIHRSLEEKGLKRYKNKVGHCFIEKKIFLAELDPRAVLTTGWNTNPPQEDLFQRRCAVLLQSLLSCIQESSVDRNQDFVC